MRYREDRDGNRLSVLGFGCMRFPRKGGGIDLAEAEREIMEAYHAGVNYYDTAYIYSGSEAALGEILARNGIRDQVNSVPCASAPASRRDCAVTVARFSSTFTFFALNTLRAISTASTVRGNPV